MSNVVFCRVLREWWKWLGFDDLGWVLGVDEMFISSYIVKLVFGIKIFSIMMMIDILVESSMFFVLCRFEYVGILML